MKPDSLWVGPVPAPCHAACYRSAGFPRATFGGAYAGGLSPPGFPPPPYTVIERTRSSRPIPKGGRSPRACLRSDGALCCAPSAGWGALRLPAALVVQSGARVRRHSLALVALSPR